MLIVAASPAGPAGTLPLSAIERGVAGWEKLIAGANEGTHSASILAPLLGNWHLSEGGTSASQPHSDRGTEAEAGSKQLSSFAFGMKALRNHAAAPPAGPVRPDAGGAATLVGVGNL